MEYYTKGKNVEEELTLEKIPIPNLPENVLWMQVRGGSKIRNLLNFAIKELADRRSVVWTGYGPSVGKAITCAEIMKKECRTYCLHQITKICYRLIQEFWDPILPELGQLVVKRQLPMIHIYLSMDPLDKDELGYQGPDTNIQYKPKQRRGSNKNNNGKVKNHFYNMSRRQQGGTSTIKNDNRIKIPTN